MEQSPHKNGANGWAADEAQRLLDGLRRQGSIYEVLSKLTLRQSEVLGAGHSDEILELARAKQEEIDRIEAIDEEIGTLKSGWREWRGEVAAELREPIEAEMERLKETLGSLIGLEEQQEREYREGRERVANELRQSEGKRRVQSAYGSEARATKPRFIDRTQ